MPIRWSFQTLPINLINLIPIDLIKNPQSRNVLLTIAFYREVPH